MVPDHKFDFRPKGLETAESCFQTAAGQDLAQKGRFPMLPEEKFNSQPWGFRRLPDGCLKAPRTAFQRLPEELPEGS